MEDITALSIKSEAQMNSAWSVLDNSISSNSILKVILEVNKVVKAGLVLNHVICIRVCTLVSMFPLLVMMCCCGEL